jgi:hypothetical protein
MARAAKGKQRQQRPQRKCIFCGEGGTLGNKMTEEHLWSQWMHDYLPQVPEMMTAHGRRHYRPGMALVQEKVRQGQPFTRGFKLVCTRCNTGWMSGIDSDTKPILLKLLQGLPVTLLRNDRRSLATWLTLKFLVCDAIDPNDSVFDQFVRSDFKASRKIPRGLQIFVGTHNSPEWHVGYRRQTMRGNLRETPATKAEHLAESQNIQSTAFGVGRLFSLTFASAIPDIKLNPAVGLIRLTRQLWPLRDRPIVWPPSHISDSDLETLARVLADLARAPFARWVP